MDMEQTTQNKPDYKILDINMALSYLLKQLNPYKPSNIYRINQGRYMILEQNYKGDILLLYKRCPYLSGEGGYRESVNTEDLKKAISSGCTRIIWIYEDKKTYTMTIQEFLEKSDIRNTSTENKTVRHTLLKNMRTL